MQVKGSKYSNKMPLPLYLYRVFLKLFSFFLFGVGCIIYVVGVFPILRLFSRTKNIFMWRARIAVRGAFSVFVKFFHITRGAIFICKGLEVLENLQGCIVVANHPSLLDVVYLISIVPNANCIVNANLSKTFAAGIIKSLYICNNAGGQAVLDECNAAIKRGENIIIFPEGTRSPRVGQATYKKGAARLALEMGANILPIFIGGGAKYGLGKGDGLFTYSKEKEYLYDIQILHIIDIKKYIGASKNLMARTLTIEIQQMLQEAQIKTKNT